MTITTKLTQLGILLPPPMKAPPGIEIPFAWVRIFGDKAYVSGHGPQNPDGSPAAPFGKVGAAVTPEQAREAARGATLSILASLQQALGDLDRITAWLRVDGRSASRRGLPIRRV